MHQHNFIPSDKPDYEVCTECGTYHSTAQEDPELIYVTRPYWDYDFKRSKIEEQVLNHLCIDDCGISKVDRVMQFIPKPMGDSIVVEAACAPGVLLKKLSDIGYETVIGVEPSGRYIQFICDQAPKAKIVQGFFPQVFTPGSNNFIDCFIALDLAEHIEDYDNFFKSIHRMLVPGGTAIIMSPIILEDGLYRKRDFEHPNEHCWIWTERFLAEYLKTIFSEVKFTRWLVGHELVILKK